MSEYTAADFATARFADDPDGGMATRDTLSSTHPWSDGRKDLSDQQMADSGWRPVLEAAEAPAPSLDTLRQWWEAAEVITDDNLPRKGDEVIELYGKGAFTIATVGGDWRMVCSDDVRILRRGARRPEGAEALEEIIGRLPEGRMTAAEMADELAKHGVRVVTGDE